MKKNISATTILLYLFITFFTSCTDSTPIEYIKEKAPIYPDYTDVTIPQNIAPLNFLVRGSSDGVRAIARFDNDSIVSDRDDNKVIFDINEWKELLTKACGKKIEVTVDRKDNEVWKRYNKFDLYVAKDSIDPYLTYRLIEPDYEVYGELSIRERCIEDFSERAICDHGLVGDRCMNCHILGNQNPHLSMMYVRGEGGGAVLNKDGKLRKLNIKTDDMIGGSVYFGFSPDGHYITFSTNIIIPSFYSKPYKRMEVFDKKSDVYIADIDNDKIIRSTLLSDSTTFETFPTFSPDGRYIYFCSAKMVKEIKDLQYDLCRITFNEKTGQIGTKTDTIISSRNAPISNKHSICHPKISPDGRYILYTVANYGTFPIWHPEADLQMMDLHTGRIDTLAIVNSSKSDTYHSWSSNSHWFVFASKRDDGLYGKPYFCYIDHQGKAHKPFVLPQQDPAFYDYNLKSFNIPELSRGTLPFKATDIANVMKKDAENFK